MSRTKTGVVRRQKHKAILAANAGFRGANHRLYKRAHEAYLHSGAYAYIGRKLRKRDMRKLWIVRINAGLKTIDETKQYSRFINQLKKAEIQVDRKMLADLVVNDFPAFQAIVETAATVK
jgi:large subunit ribosomal protein L20